MLIPFTFCVVASLAIHFSIVRPILRKVKVL